MSSRHGPGRGINILVAFSIVFPMFFDTPYKDGFDGQFSMFLKVRTRSGRECVIVGWRNDIKNLERFTNLRVILAQGPC